MGECSEIMWSEMMFIKTWWASNKQVFVAPQLPRSPRPLRPFTRLVKSVSKSLTHPLSHPEGSIYF